MGNLSAKVREGFTSFKDSLDEKAFAAAQGTPGKIASVGLKGAKVALDGYGMITGNDTNVASAALNASSRQLDMIRGKDIDLERETNMEQMEAMHGGELVPPAVGLLQDVKELSDEFSREPDVVPEAESVPSAESVCPDEPSTGMEQWMARAEEASAAEAAFVEEGVSAMTDASDSAAQAWGDYGDAYAGAVSSFEAGESGGYADASPEADAGVDSGADAGADASASAD